jgi:hypothetical protein
VSRTRNYEKRPLINVDGATAIRSWDAIVSELSNATNQHPGVIVVDCYPGVDVGEVKSALARIDSSLTSFDPSVALRSPDDMENMVKRFLTSDRVFGYMAPFVMSEFFDAGRLAALREQIRESALRGPVAIIGVGAAMIVPGDVLVIADMPRWELQLRYRRGAPNWTIDNPGEDFLRKYKRGYFFLDTTIAMDPKLVTGAAYRSALAGVTDGPFRVVPFFDPGVWGGQWMRRQFDLPKEPPNFAWGFDCVPEENSILFNFGGIEFESPSINLVLRHPKPLLGDRVYSRFGAEFPIRFDFLDTCEGGNLSLQVHPTTDYIRQTFGMSYTQDESYYILAASHQAAVYLGMKNGASVDQLIDQIEHAQRGGPSPDIERFVNRRAVKKHDHISIPAGTIHCAGAGCVVLEISATPYIFTFKLWDWGRTGLDGLPRPVHLDHGRRVLEASHDADWVERTVLTLQQDVAAGEGWREERTGLHEVQFIETRRHWFSEPVLHDTHGSVNVVNLVEGDWATIESPTQGFPPFHMNFAETVIIPAVVGAYRIVPSNRSQHATIRASVRI